MKVYETIGINGIKLLRLFNYYVGSIRDYKTRQNGENHCRAQDLKRLIREEYQQQRKQKKAFEATLKEVIEAIPKYLTPRFQPLSSHDDDLL